ASGRARWAAAAVALLAMFAKETAIAWGLVVALVEARSGRRAWRVLVPSVVAAFVFALAAGGILARYSNSVAYERSWSPLHLVRNLATYAQWSVSLHQPI